MGINKKLLPVKVHFFFFIAAFGPVYPQLGVYGKELGISSVVTGIVTAVLPFIYFLAKPIFGVLIDVYRNYRKCMFIALIVAAQFFAGLYFFIQPKTISTLHYQPFNYSFSQDCNVTLCLSGVVPLLCTTDCFNGSFLATYDSRICIQIDNVVWENLTCGLTCVKDSRCLYKTFIFLEFIIFFSAGCVVANVVSSINDAICFDVMGEDGDYGRQRVWGAIGCGISALISGCVSSLLPESEYKYTPTFAAMLVCTAIDIAACTKLQLPLIEPPKNILKDFKHLFKNATAATFLIFTFFVGILNSITIFFLFLYLEDLAVTTNTKNIKLIEGFTIAAETLGGEILFFAVSGKILKRFGHVTCLSASFVFYGLRLGSIAMAPSPWWIALAQFCFSGPAFALAYSAVVAYANELAPPGASATMQGIASGMSDGFGWCVGSLTAGYLFKCVGARNTFYIFSLFGFVSAIAHFLLHKTLLSRSDYKTPEEAYNGTK